MKQIWKMIILVLAAAMVLSGCVMQTVDELYCLPQRPQADDDLQKVIDQAMFGMSYCAPIYGENRQMLQRADLDGDGISEYIILARDSSKKSIKLLIFRRLAVGYVLSDTIEGYGSAFDFIQFENLDDHPGAEIIVGRQVGDGLVRSAAVYRLEEGKAERMLEVSYSHFLCNDLDGDGRSELVLVYPSESGDVSSSVRLYRYEDGQLMRSDELKISNPSANIDRMETFILQDGSSAVLVTSTEGYDQLLEVFYSQGGKLNYVYGPVSVEKLNDQFVYPTDADGDGATDLPKLIPILDKEDNKTGEYWIRWYSVGIDGSKKEGMYTYYCAEGKWYLHIDMTWAHALTVSRSEDACTFYNQNKELVMTIYTLSGSNRKEQAKQLGGIVLGSSESVTFVAVVGPGAKAFGITENRIRQLFYPIELKLYT